MKKVQNSATTTSPLIDNVVSYLGYLNEACGLCVSVHFDDACLRRLPVCDWQKLARYNAHTNPYCMAVKGSGRHAQCIRSQRELLKNVRGESGFCRTCHAGVYEYIRTFSENGVAIGFVAVSGYRQKEWSVGVIDKEKWENSLREQEIPLDFCETLIPPLCVMLEKVFGYYAEEIESEQTLMLQFLNEYHTSVTLSEFCKHFGRSKSYVSHTFKSTYGMTFCEYCNNLKMEDAKKLLISTERSVTEIAFAAGYNDVSYFIRLFRERWGCSPLQYRKKYAKA